MDVHESAGAVENSPPGEPNADEKPGLAPADVMLALDAINGQLDRQSKLVATLFQRASILVGASGISTALLTREDLSAVWLLPIGLFVASIILAVLSLSFPRGSQLNPRSVLDSLEKKTQPEFEQSLIKALVKTYETAYPSIVKRSRQLGAGMILFAAGWVTSFMILYVQAFALIEGRFW